MSLFSLILVLHALSTWFHFVSAQIAISADGTKKISGATFLELPSQSGLIAVTNPVSLPGLPSYLTSTTKTVAVTSTVPSLQPSSTITSPATSSTSAISAPRGSHHNSTILGPIVGGVLGLGVICLAALYVLRRRSSSPRPIDLVEDEVRHDGPWMSDSSLKARPYLERPNGSETEKSFTSATSSPRVAYPNTQSLQSQTPDHLSPSTTPGISHDQSQTRSSPLSLPQTTGSKNTSPLPSANVAHNPTLAPEPTPLTDLEDVDLLTPPQLALVQRLSSSNAPRDSIADVIGLMIRDGQAVGDGPPPDYMSRSSHLP